MWVPRLLSQFFKYLTIAYLVLGVLWIGLSWMNRRSLLPLQNYLTLLSLLLILEHFLTYRYESYLNDVGHPGVAGAFLVLVSVISAARNSISLYLLCLASMGLSIVRPGLGGALGRVRLLALFHFVFGTLYVPTLSLSHRRSQLRSEFAADTLSDQVPYQSIRKDSSLSSSSFL